LQNCRQLIDSSKLRATVIHYAICEARPRARSSIWNIASGREALRRYALSQTEARYVLFLDADMIFEPSVIEVMEREIQGYDVVFSGYPLRQYGMGLAGAGCAMLSRSILEKLEFRCYEFKNGEVIFEDNVLEMDLFRLGSRVKKGFSSLSTHYASATESRRVTPHPVGPARRITNAAFVRYALIGRA